MSQELKDIIVRLRMALIKEAGSKGYWEHAMVNRVNHKYRVPRPDVQAVA